MLAEIVKLLAGDPAALQQRRQAHAGTDSVCGDEVQVWSVAYSILANGESLQKFSKCLVHARLPSSCIVRTYHVHKAALQACELDDERVRLQQQYNECNYCIYGGPEAAAAAG
jgi:hypothetical protein